MVYDIKGKVEEMNFKDNEVLARTYVRMRFRRFVDHKFCVECTHGLCRLNNSEFCDALPNIRWVSTHLFQLDKNGKKFYIGFPISPEINKLVWEKLTSSSLQSVLGYFRVHTNSLWIV